jgi:hypothetical protein
MEKSFLILLFLVSLGAHSQKVDSIFFNLYTDSLKKGVYNYINVDGKLSNGAYLPLMSDELVFSSTLGRWDGNNLIIDRSIIVDSVVITAAIKNRPEVRKSVTVYVKKIEAEPALKTEEELLNEWRKKGGRKKN